MQLADQTRGDIPWLLGVPIFLHVNRFGRILADYSKPVILLSAGSRPENLPVARAEFLGCREPVATGKGELSDHADTRNSADQVMFGIEPCQR